MQLHINVMPSQPLLAGDSAPPSQIQEAGVCPGIAMLAKIEAFMKKRRSHLPNSTSIIFLNNETVGEKGILGPAPRAARE